MDNLSWHSTALIFTFFSFILILGTINRSLFMSKSFRWILAGSCILTCLLWIFSLLFEIHQDAILILSAFNFLAWLYIAVSQIHFVLKKLPKHREFEKLLADRRLKQEKKVTEAKKKFGLGEYNSSRNPNNTSG